MLKPRTRQWLIGGWFVLCSGCRCGVCDVTHLSRRFEPYLREQAIEYLQKRFDSDVEIAILKVRLPKASPIRLVLTNGRGAIARVEGSGIVLRHRESGNYPPLLTIRHFTFDADLGTLGARARPCRGVALEASRSRCRRAATGRASAGAARSRQPRPQQPDQSAQTGVVIEKVQIQDLALWLLPKDSAKVPLRFEIHHLNLRSAGTGFP